MPRKRTHDEMAAPSPPQEQTAGPLLQRIRSMWEFASTMQYIFLFGKAVKIDEDFDIEDFEEECLKPGRSEKLEVIGLTLLKWISSFRALDHSNWDEYTRRQYQAKAPNRNPYGEEEEPKKFKDFDIFTRIRVLHQLTVWTFWNPDRIRERMPEHPRDADQLEWRIEELGWDSDERGYYVLDDNRLYRRTEPPLAPAPKAKPKATSMKAQAARRRSNKRRKVVHSETPDPRSSVDIDEEQQQNEDETDKDKDSTEKDTFGGFQWECLAITLAEYQQFVESMKKSRDPNEKALRLRLINEVMPTIESAEERQRRKMERRQRELQLLEKMAGAKRSSRLAGRQEREREEREKAETERKHAADLAAAHREQERQSKMEQDRKSRMMTREQRIKDREYKRVLQEEEVARLAEEQQKIEEGTSRGSERHLKERLEKHKKELEDLNAEEDWTFDCSGCGVYGKNIDDGSHSVACERCNVWQHSKCLGISKAAADKDDFHFICDDCKQKEEEANRPKISLKFKVGSSSSPAPPSPLPQLAPSPNKQHFAGVEIPKHSSTSQSQNGIKFVHSSPPQQQAVRPPYHSNGHPAQPTTNPYNQILSRQSLQAGNHAQANQLQGQLSPSRIAQQVAPYSHPNGATPRPGSSGQPLQHSYYPHAAHHQTPSHHGYLPNSTPHQNNALQSQSLQRTPQPSFTSAQTNGAAPSARLPSPIVNRPTISPTQGNFDVGSVAGVPQNQHPHTNAGPIQKMSQAATPQVNGTRHQTTPTSSLSSQPSPAPYSGISPVKHSPNPPIMPSSIIPPKSNMSPPFPPPRSVSGTPVFPPTEKLQPSPELLHKLPVPTPSKQATPATIGDQEMRRVSEEVQRAVNGSNDVEMKG